MARRKNDKDESRLGCAVPPVVQCRRGLPLPTAIDGVKMTCTNKDCPFKDQYLHQECFDILEDHLVQRIAVMTRNWTDSQRRANLWDNKGYTLIRKLCRCPCVMGMQCLDKDVLYAKQLAEEAENKRKAKAKKPKLNEKPKLNQKGPAPAPIEKDVKKTTPSYFRENGERAANRRRFTDGYSVSSGISFGDSLNHSAPREGCSSRMSAWSAESDGNRREDDDVSVTSFPDAFPSLGRSAASAESSQVQPARSYAAATKSEEQSSAVVVENEAKTPKIEEVTGNCVNGNSSELLDIPERCSPLKIRNDQSPSSFKSGSAKHTRRSSPLPLKEDREREDKPPSLEALVERYGEYTLFGENSLRLGETIYAEFCLPGIFRGAEYRERLAFEVFANSRGFL